MKLKRIMTFLMLIIFIAVFSSPIIADSKVSATVDFINVGQGDAILIVTGGSSVLIDAGPKKDAKEVLAQIKKKAH